jgi:hypothetical protein
MNSPLITALGATLFHFLWEGALIALLPAAFRTEQKTRYRLAMLAMPAAFFITLFTVMPESFHSFGLDGGCSIAADTAGNVYVTWHGIGESEASGKGAEGEARRCVWLTKSTDDGESF